MEPIDDQYYQRLDALTLAIQFVKGRGFSRVDATDIASYFFDWLSNKDNNDR